MLENRASINALRLYVQLPVFHSKIHSSFPYSFISYSLIHSFPHSSFPYSSRIPLFSISHTPLFFHSFIRFFIQPSFIISKFIHHSSFIHPSFVHSLIHTFKHSSFHSFINFLIHSSFPHLMKARKALIPNARE